MTSGRRLSGHFAGSFYPEDAAVLESELAAWMDTVPRCPHLVAGVLAPHAGYVYSGATAAHAVARARGGEVDTVVVLALSHRHPVDGVGRFDVEGFETPLGCVEVDAEFAGAPMLAAAGVRVVAPFAEHSLEVQLPMLRRAWPGAKVVPLLFGEGDPARWRELGRRLARSWTPAVRVLATTDLSHYHDRATARVLDDVFAREIVGGDVDRMIDALRAGRTEACGEGPVVTWMEFAHSLGARVEVVDRSDSGDAFGETDRVVGYLSALAHSPRVVEVVEA